MQWTFWQNSVGFQAAWELDFWGKFRRSVEAAGAQLAASVADYDNALVSLQANVASTYVTLRVAEERLRIARINTALERESLAIATTRFRYGATSDRDVQQAKALLESTLATVPAVQGRHPEIQARPVPAPGHAAHGPFGPPGRNGRHPGLPRPRWAWASRRSSCAAGPISARPNSRPRAQCARIGVAKADLFPSFSPDRQRGLALLQHGGLLPVRPHDRQELHGTACPPGFTWNLFNYGRIMDTVRAQDAVFQQALLAYRNTVLTGLERGGG